MTSKLRLLSELCASNVVLIDPKQEPDKEFWYLDISSVDNATKRITGAQRVKGADASVRARQVISKDDILVSTTRPQLNGVAKVPDQFDQQVCSTGFCVLRTGPDLDANYLFAFVRSKRFIDCLSDLVQGALYPAVTQRQVLGQRIPWIPVAEQEVIGSLLERELDQVDQAIAAANMQISELRTLSSSILAEFFRD